MLTIQPQSSLARPSGLATPGCQRNVSVESAGLTSPVKCCVLILPGAQAPLGKPALLRPLNLPRPMPSLPQVAHYAQPRLRPAPACTHAVHAAGLWVRPPKAHRRDSTRPAKQNYVCAMTSQTISCEAPPLQHTPPTCTQSGHKHFDCAFCLRGRGLEATISTQHNNAVHVASYPSPPRRRSRCAPNMAARGSQAAPHPSHMADEPQARPAICRCPCAAGAGAQPLVRFDRRPRSAACMSSLWQ